MRVITLAILLAPSIAAADGFFQLAGGLSTPVGDDDWNNVAEPSPKLSLRAAGINNRIGGYISADWIPQQTDAGGFSFPGGMTDVSAQRFRLLVGPIFEAPVTRALTFSARLGIGADIAYANVETTTVLGSASASDTDVGFAFEVGGGLWVNVGSMQVGGELALPVGRHDDEKDSNDDIAMQWTSYDFDIMAGVRFRN